jgi:hypothetical protein
MLFAGPWASPTGALRPEAKAVLAWVFSRRLLRALDRAVRGPIGIEVANEYRDHTPGETRLRGE